MQKMVNVVRTSRGGVYVNGELMRTRSAEWYVSNKYSANKIMEDIATATNFTELPVAFDATITISDTKFEGGVELTIYSRSRSRNWYNEYKTKKGDRIELPCDFWFKKLFGTNPPDKLWISMSL